MDNGNNGNIADITIIGGNIDINISIIANISIEDANIAIITTNISIIVDNANIGNKL